MKANLIIAALLILGALAAGPVAAPGGPEARPTRGRDARDTGSAATSSPASKPASQPADLGPNANLHRHKFFPADNPWNKDVSKDAVDPNSDALVKSIGLEKGLHPDFGPSAGIPYVVVDGKQPRVAVEFEYKDESDPGPYPIPADAPIEGGKDAGGDRHVLVLDRDNWRLYETWSSFPLDGGKRWKAGSGAIFDLTTGKLRPAGWTSADAAGLPILPGLVRWDEVGIDKEITHAVRFTCVKTRRAYVSPATHWASNKKDANLPPMGMRVRLKAGCDISGYSPQVQVILKALKKYGMILADNGSDWFISGSPSPQWDNEILSQLKKVKGKDLEVVKMGEMVTR
jgi:hypothetical protein